MSLFRTVDEVWILRHGFCTFKGMATEFLSLIDTFGSSVEPFDLIVYSWMVVLQLLML